MSIFYQLFSGDFAGLSEGKNDVF